MEPSPQRLREAARTRDAALRVLFEATGPKGDGFLGLRDQLKAEATSHDFALSQRRYGISNAFKAETEGFKTTPETLRRLVAALRGGGGGDAGASGFAAERATCAPERACIAIAALRGCPVDLIAEGAFDALVPMICGAVADLAPRVRRRAEIGFEACGALLDAVSGTYGKHAVSDALLEAGLLVAVEAVAETRGPEYSFLRWTSFGALSQVGLESQNGLPRLRPAVVANLLELALVAQPGPNDESGLSALDHIAYAVYNAAAEGLNICCAPGVLDTLVSPRGLSCMTHLVLTGHMNFCGSILGKLCGAQRLREADTPSYALSIGACDELLDALFDVIALDAAGARVYLNRDRDVDTTTVIRNHEGYDQPGGFEGTPDPRVNALEVLGEVLKAKGFGDGAGERLRPLVPLLTSLLVETCSPTAQYGPDTYETRHFACRILGRFCRDFNLSRAVVDAHGLDALTGVLDRRVLPGSTATPRLIGATESAAMVGIISVIAAGHITAARDAISASAAIQPNATPFQALYVHEALRAFAHLTPALWREEWLHKSWIQEILHGR